MLTFLGELPVLNHYEDYLPKQKGKIIELKDHQQEAIDNLEDMRKSGESIALLYHATGERVIIVMGALNALESKVSGTLNRYISRIT